MEIVSTTYTTIGGRVREHIRLFRSVYVVVRIFGKTPAVTVSEFRNGGATVKNRVRKLISVLAPVNIRTTITPENAYFRERTPSKFRYNSPSWTLGNAIFEHKPAPIRLSVLNVSTSAEFVSLTKWWVWLSRCYDLCGLERFLNGILSHICGIEPIQFSVDKRKLGWLLWFGEFRVSGLIYTGAEQSALSHIRKPNAVYEQF